MSPVLEGSRDCGQRQHAGDDVGGIDAATRFMSMATWMYLNGTARRQTHRRHYRHADYTDYAAGVWATDYIP